MVTLDFEFWYRAEYPRLVNTLAMVTGDRSLATDSAAEACTKALARWNKVGKMECPGGWVYRVALNDARRRGKRKSLEAKLLARKIVDIEHSSSPAHVDVDLWAAVDRLPQRTKEAVVLRYVADLTEPEIAKALGVARGTVATMLRRANAKLAEELGPQASAPAEELTDVYKR